MADNKSSSTRASARTGYGGWFSPVSASGSIDTASSHRTTVESSVDDTRASRGNRSRRTSPARSRVNFKSDFLPMDRMATPEMIAAITGNAQPPLMPAGSGLARACVMSAPTITPVWLSGDEDRAVEALEAALATAWGCIDGTVGALSVLDPFEPIDLPDSVPSAQQQERLRLIGPLYLAAQLEATRLVDAAETVAGLYVSSALPVAGARAGESGWVSGAIAPCASRRSSEVRCSPGCSAHRRGWRLRQVRRTWRSKG